MQTSTAVPTSRKWREIVDDFYDDINCNINGPLKYLQEKSATLLKELNGVPPEALGDEANTVLAATQLMQGSLLKAKRLFETVDGPLPMWMWLIASRFGYQHGVFRIEFEHGFNGYLFEVAIQEPQAPKDTYQMLVTAAACGNLELLQKLDAGSKGDVLREEPEDGEDTIAECAAKAGHIDILRYLLRQGAFTEAHDHRYALRYAAMNGHRHVVFFMLQYQDELGIDFEGVKEAFEAAVRNFQVDVLQDLIDEKVRYSDNLLISVFQGEAEVSKRIELMTFLVDEARCDVGGLALPLRYCKDEALKGEVQRFLIGRLDAKIVQIEAML